MERAQLDIAYKNFISDNDVSRLELLIDRPNIFNALKVGQAEIRHSNFLSWLLDPLANHGLEDKFFKRFVREVLILSNSKIDLVDIEEIDLDLVRVNTEFLNIDILIEIEDLVIVVENKINSKEHGSQLTNYFNRAHSQFRNAEIVFVYMTVDGDSPSTNSYIPFSYSKVEKQIVDILEVYRESLNPSVQLYLQDYLHLLKDYIMNNGEINELTKKIYRNHRILLDKILEFRQDSIAYMRSFFEKKVLSNGWILCSVGRGKVRFLTPNLSEIIPKRKSGWTENETFLFEIDYTYAYSKKIRFCCIISPGDNESWSKLREIFKEILPRHKTSGEQWLTYFDFKVKFDVNEWALKEPTEIESYISIFFEEIEKSVLTVEEGISKHKDDLLLLKGRPL